MVKCLPATRGTQVRFLGGEDPLEKEMATHSSTLAWKIPWMEEPDRLQSMGSQRVGHDWATSLSFTMGFPGVGNDNPLQYSCLENSRERGAWWTTVYGVTKSQTQLKWLSMHVHMTFSKLLTLSQRLSVLSYQIDKNDYLILSVWRFKELAQKSRNWEPVSICEYLGGKLKFEWIRPFSTKELYSSKNMYKTNPLWCHKGHNKDNTSIFQFIKLIKLDTFPLKVEFSKMWLS